MVSIKSITSIAFESHEYEKFRNLLIRQGVTQTFVFGNFIKQYNEKYSVEPEMPKVLEAKVEIPDKLTSCDKCGSEYTEASHSRCPGCVDGIKKEVDVVG